MKRKLLSAVLALSILFSLCTAVSAAFEDVSENQWYYDAVNFVTEKNYFTGISQTEFGPDIGMTRGMFVTVLGRFAGIDRASYMRDTFSDVSYDSWYYPYVAWANESGITSGYEDGRFAPDDPINREQIAVIINRYLANNDIELADNPNALGSYSDEDEVSSWAYDGVELMRRTAIFTGNAYGCFIPQADATRAEIANVLKRLTQVMSGATLDVPVPLPSEEPQNPTEQTGNEASSRVMQILNEMSLKEKIYQMFMITPEQLTGVAGVTAAGQITKEALAKQPVGGLVYDKHNVVSDYQLPLMLSNTKSYMNIVPFTAIEEEGGSDSKLTAVPHSTVKNMYEYRDESADNVYAVGATLANDLSRYGFNMNFAPVADVWSNAKNNIIGERAFSTSPQTAGGLVAAEVKGLQESGVSAVLKHFPGYGDVLENKTTSKVVSSKTLEQLRNTEFVPFKNGIDAGADFVMCSHVSAAAVDAEYPASMSKVFITDILRSELGFNGVVITDMLSADAVRRYYNSVQAAINCVNAGADMLLCPDTFSEAANGLFAAVQNGQISEERINESVKRILTVKLNRGIIQ